MVLPANNSQTFRFGQTPVSLIANPEITAGELKVYSALASYRNHKTGKAWPSRKILAELTGFNPDYISRATAKLVDIGARARTHLAAPRTCRNANFQAS